METSRLLGFDWKWSEPEDASRADRRDDSDLAPWPPLQDLGLLGRWVTSVQAAGWFEGAATMCNSERCSLTSKGYSTGLRVKRQPFTR